MIYFVSGTGTGVGKTVATGLAARDLARRGVDAITVKMVQTGDAGFSEDVEEHRRLAGGGPFPEDAAGLTAPQVFAFPASPLLAAELEGRRVDFSAIDRAVAACAEAHSVVLVEGAGGLAVPLDGETLAIDFAAARGWPLVLVADGRLGAINHTLLSLEAVKARGMALAGVVHVEAPAGTDPRIDADAERAVRRALERDFPGVPLVRLPRFDVSSGTVPDVDFSPIFATWEPARSAAAGAGAGGSDAARPVSAARSAADLDWDRRKIWHPYASLGTPPPVFEAVRGLGAEVELADGTRLVDAVASWWSVAHGHDHPAIVEAVKRQASRMTHVMFGGFTHEPAVALSRRLAAIAPEGLDNVFFADSGSIAVEVASKMAVQYQRALGRPERCKLLALRGGYHGDTAGAMALSDPDGMHVLFRGIMPKHFFADKPSVPFDGEWDDACLASVERAFDEHGGEIAAAICEPVFQAANAMWFYHPRFLRGLRRICDERGALLVYDEIAAGLWRTGRRWAHEHAGDGAAPDVLCTGKALTGGAMTLAAVLASDRVAGTISGGRPSAFMHGPTFMANPLACAAACASLDLFAASDYAEKARRIERAFRTGLEPLRGAPNVADVRVLGAAGVVELVSPPAPEDVRRVILETGVWLRPFAGFVYSIPPFVVSDSQLSRICEAIRAVAALPPGPPPDDPDFHE